MDENRLKVMHAKQPIPGPIRICTSFGLDRGSIARYVRSRRLLFTSFVIFGYRVRRTENVTFY